MQRFHVISQEISSPIVVIQITSNFKFHLTHISFRQEGVNISGITKFNIKDNRTNRYLSHKFLPIEPFTYVMKLPNEWVFEPYSDVTIESDIQSGYSGIFALIGIKED